MASPIKTVKDTRALLQELNRHPDVEYAVPNLIYELVASPNDPYYSSSGAWGQDYKDMWGLHNINAERAWDVTQGEGIVVAVVDTGVDYKHEDIDQNIWQNPGETGNDSSGKNKSSNGIDDDNNGYVDDWRGWDFPALSEEGEDNNPMDDHYHGTHVAGTIAAIGNNSQGVIGVAPKAKIMALKALNQNGVGTTVSVARAIMYAADNGARVINASLGALLPIPDRPMEEAINYAVDVKGVVFVAAAGNDDSNVERVTLNTGNNGRNGEGDGSIRLSFYYPASSEKVITVAASNHLDEKAYFSNFGPKIDVAAPGGGDQDESNPNPYPEKSILSLLSSKANLGLVRGGPDRVVGGKYFRAEGTSMAAPHVAGVAALVLSKNPHFLVEQVRQAIRLGADDAGATGFDQDTGHGRINAARALEIVAPPAPDINGCDRR